MNLSEIQQQIGRNDPLSWLSHLLICAPFTYLGTHVHPLAGVFISEALMLGFGVREGSNWKTHKVKGHPMRRAVRDGIGDMAGPVLCHVYAVLAFLTIIPTL